MFKIASKKKIAISRNKLTKEVKDLHSENYKTPMKETEDDSTVMERHPVLLDWKN